MSRARHGRSAWLGAPIVVLAGCRAILGLDDVSLHQDAPVNEAGDEPVIANEAGDADAAIDAPDGPREGVCATSGFCWMNPLPQGNTLTSTYARSATDVWAGGDYGTIMHWDGARWYGRARDPREQIVAITGTPDGRVWALGQRGAAPVAPFLVVSPVSDPLATIDTWADLSPGAIPPFPPHALWFDGADDLYIGGGDTSAILYRYTLSTQTLTAVLSQPGGSILAIWGTSPDDIWAVGANNTALHFVRSLANGWQQIYTARGSGMVWLGVAATKTAPFALILTGNDGAGGVITEITSSPAGAQFTQNPTPTTQFTSVVRGADGAMWAVGSDGPAPVIYERDPATGIWTLEATASGSSGLLGVTSIADEGWAVGQRGTIFHRTGHAWTKVSKNVELGEPNPGFGQRIAPISGTEVVITGGTGIGRFGAGDPVVENLGVVATVTDLEVVGATTWAATSIGALVRSATGAWAPETSGASPVDEASLFAASATDVAIVTRAASGKHLQNGTWGSIPPLLDIEAHEIWGTGGSLYLVGQCINGSCNTLPAISRLDGITWTPLYNDVFPTGARGPLFAIWGRSATEVYTGGDLHDVGTGNKLPNLYTLVGTIWQATMLTGPPGDVAYYPVRTIHGGPGAGSDTWAGGLPRYVWHTKPGGWEIVPSGTTSAIGGLFVVSAGGNDVWIAGEKSVVLRKR